MQIIWGAGRVGSANGSSAVRGSHAEAAAAAAERRQRGAGSAAEGQPEAAAAAHEGGGGGFTFGAAAPWIAEASLQLPAGDGVLITPGLVAVRSQGATMVALAARAQWMF